MAASIKDQVFGLNAVFFALNIALLFVEIKCHQRPEMYVSEFQQNEPDFHRRFIDKGRQNLQKQNSVFRKNNIGNKNLGNDFRTNGGLKDGEVVVYEPGQPALSFDIWELNGKLEFPENPIFLNKSVIMHVFDPDSAFLECLWTSDEGLSPLFEDVSKNTVYIFVPKRADVNDKYGAVWMQNRLKALAATYKVAAAEDVMKRFVFSVLPFYKLGSWIPAMLRQWQCVDHLCGLDQAVIQTNTTPYPRVIKRLNARYDWLPSPESVFGNKTLPLVQAGDGCKTTTSVNMSVALVSSQGCSVFDKLSNMYKSGAKAVVIYADRGTPVQEITCKGEECTADISIPAVSVEWTDVFISNATMNITFQNTPSENFFAAIDRSGNLAEVGWFLFPSMRFLNWQSQWFDYKADLQSQLSLPQIKAEVFHEKTMQGHDGVVVNYTLPNLHDMMLYKKIQLDVSLSCPGTKDTSCAHWDRIMTLFVCCDQTSPLCGMELGRWITPFRRRIGHWLTDISPLLPLLGEGQCTFTMKTDWYAMPWNPSLNILFSEKREQGDVYPAEAFILYQPGATFNRSYNSNFKPYNFTVPKDVLKVEIYAVITGHGSDENGCGEFCVTSHHFDVNGHVSNIMFSEAGTPFGCAEQVLTGVEPNEHGTWLYGRNGWCDGRNVFPVGNRHYKLP
ncbi:hypothetical protein FSP39_025233 [Pinctada imbricata]|uniref:Peptide-N-glycosidase F N-terminal domain-containing protein n=1 Tax=Pinctada imbricata TaxID=66713 RepID=A0AA89CD06_PINIB|nr:hypothetical protein FSP39_025233 [Pinctada imbricata]